MLCLQPAICTGDTSSFASKLHCHAHLRVTQEFLPSSTGTSPVKCHSPTAVRAAAPAVEACAPAPMPTPVPMPAPRAASHASPCKPPALDAGAANAEAAAAPVDALHSMPLIPPLKALAPGTADADAGAPILAALAGIKDVQVLSCDDVNLAVCRASTTGFGMSLVSDRFSCVHV